MLADSFLLAGHLHILNYTIASHYTSFNHLHSYFALISMEAPGTVMDNGYRATGVSTLAP